MCTPPWKPVSNLPLPLPPASTWAFITSLSWPLEQNVKTRDHNKRNWTRRKSLRHHMLLVATLQVCFSVLEFHTVKSCVLGMKYVNIGKKDGRRSIVSWIGIHVLTNSASGLQTQTIWLLVPVKQNILIDIHEPKSLLFSTTLAFAVEEEIA